MTSAVCIGGSSGIGLAAARLALAQGWDVTIASRNPARAEIAANKVTLDLTDSQAVTGFFAQLGPIDHLLCTAVARAAGHAKELDLQAARSAFDAKLWGPLAAIQAADVRVSITLASGVAASTPQAGGSITAAVNGAVEALVRTLAVELAPVRVNAVAPGVIATPLWDELLPNERQNMFDDLAQSLPVGRLGDANDIAEAILFLMSNGFVTGEILHVDGGHRLAGP